MRAIRNATDFLLDFWKPCAFMNTWYRCSSRCHVQPSSTQSIFAECFKSYSVLEPPESFCDTLDTQQSQGLKVRGLTSPPGTSGSIQSCHLQLNAPAFLSWRRGPTRNFSLGYTPEWTDMPRCMIKKSSELWNMVTSQGVRRPYRFFLPSWVSTIFLILTWEGPPSCVLHIWAFT